MESFEETVVFTKTPVLVAIQQEKYLIDLPEKT
jgi:hypothetical protein